MSGPIVRKYGFPNFEKIFGERELKHGAEGSAVTPSETSTPGDATKPTPSGDSIKLDETPSKP